MCAHSRQSLLQLAHLPWFTKQRIARNAIAGLMTKMCRYSQNQKMDENRQYKIIHVWMILGPNSKIIHINYCLSVLYRETDAIYNHPMMDDSYIQKWMILVISLWMFIVWNKFHPKMDDFVHPIMDDSIIIH
jgi:hypothetical protein